MQKWLIRSRCGLRDNSHGPMARNHVLNGIKIPHENGQFLRVVRPIEKHWQYCCGVCSKRDQQNDMRDGLSSKFFDHFLYQLHLPMPMNIFSAVVHMTSHSLCFCCFMTFIYYLLLVGQ